MRLRTHPFTILSYLLLGFITISQSSCYTVTDRSISGPSVRRDIGVTSLGTPVVTLIHHPDDQGWTVSVTQPLHRHVEIVRSERKERHSYYPNPFAIPAGMFACPSSVWGWFWTAVATIPDPTRQLEQQKALLDFTFTSCLMALSIVRTDPKVKDVETVVEHKLEPDSRPLTEGRVTLSWQGTREVSVPYPVTADGRAIVRLSHLATALQHHEVSFTTVPRGRIELAAWHRDHVLYRWPVEVTAEQLEAAVQMEMPVMAPRSRWPRSPVFKIATESLPAARPDPVSTVQDLLVQQGLTVVASEAQQPLVLRALEQNLTGLVEDDLAIGLGHWRAATVLVLITGSSEANQSSVSVSCVNVQTRELLAHLEVTAGPEGFSGALDVLAIRFQNLLRHLPNHAIPSGR